MGKACTILLRGASKDILNEVERNLQDALNVARNLYQDPALVPGGGAAEMEVAHLLGQKAKSLNGVIQWPYKAVATALEVIPRTLAQNCGANTIRTLTALRAKHAKRVRRMLTGASMGRLDSWRICQKLVFGNHCRLNYRCTRQPSRPLFSFLELTTSCRVQRREGMWEVRDLPWIMVLPWIPA